MRDFQVRYTRTLAPNILRDSYHLPSGKNLVKYSQYNSAPN